jgi:sigma-B regulation protein RsbU (phosphoserine phosphatase)
MAEIDDLKNLLEVYRGLVEVSGLINSITQYDELLPAILDVAQRVMDAEASTLLLADEFGNLRVIFARGPVDITLQQKVVIPRGQGIAGWVFENGCSILVPDAYADPRFYSEVDKKSGFLTRSILCTPLMRDGKKTGVLQVLNPRKKEAFSDRDLEAFDAYASLVATAIEKLRTIDDQRHQEQVTRELAIAHEIQNSFLPQHLPELSGLRFGASYRSALNIGGDFYDVIRVGADEVYFVIGDVSGKGIPAALLMAQALSMLRLILKEGMSPDAALKKWNQMLFGHTIRGMFITAIVGQIVPELRTIELASAGHCAPLIVDAMGNVKEVFLKNSQPLGVLETLDLQSASLNLAPEEWLVLFTDGLSESFSPEGVLLERTGIQRLLTRRFTNVDEVVEALEKGESLHRKEAEPHDDLTILCCGFGLPE